MKIGYNKHFLKKFNRFPRKIQNKFKERIELFVNDSGNITLRDHPLRGDLKGKRAFRITGDIRVIYQYLKKDEIKLLNIGPHSEVY